MNETTKVTIDYSTNRIEIITNYSNDYPSFTTIKEVYHSTTPIKIPAIAKIGAFFTGTYIIQGQFNKNIQIRDYESREHSVHIHTEHSESKLDPCKKIEIPYSAVLEELNKGILITSEQASADNIEMTGLLPEQLHED